MGRMGKDGWLTIGWPKEYGGQGTGRRRAVHLLGRDVPRARAAPADHGQHGRTDADPVRERGAEGRDPAADPRRRAAGRDRLHRAGRRHRPRLAPDARRARRRPLRGERPEALHHPRPGRRLHLARGAHRPGRAEAQGHLDPAGADRHARLLAARRSAPSAASSPTPPTTRTCACRSRTGSVPRTRGWGLITNQLNLERITLAMPGLGRPRCSRRCGPGPAKAAAPGGGRDARPALGAAEPGARLREARGAEAAELALGLADRPGPPGDGRRLRGEGDGHGAADRVLPAAARDHRRRRARCGEASPARSSAACSSRPTAARWSTPSAAA